MRVQDGQPQPNDPLSIARLWQKSTPRSQLKLAIKDALDTFPEAYDRPLSVKECSALFEHMFESYLERDVKVYASVAC